VPLQNGHRAAAAALLDRGASTAAADDAGETPVGAAERRALCSAKVGGVSKQRVLHGHGLS
jgi:hypothetical protein